MWFKILVLNRLHQIIKYVCVKNTNLLTLYAGFAANYTVDIPDTFNTNKEAIPLSRDY